MTSLVLEYGKVLSNYSEMLPEIHTMEKCDFLKPLSHSQLNSLFYFRISMTALTFQQRTTTKPTDSSLTTHIKQQVKRCGLQK